MELALSVIGRLASRAKRSKTLCISGWIQEEDLGHSGASLTGHPFESYRAAEVARKALWARKRNNQVPAYLSDRSWMEFLSTTGGIERSKKLSGNSR